MRKMFLAVVVLFLLCVPALAQDEALNIDVKEKVLANGLRVLVVERRGAPEVVCRLFYDVGSANEVPGITGASHLCEHSMFKGTRIIGTKDADKDAGYNKRIDEIVLKMQRLKADEEKNAEKLKALQKELDELREAQKEITIKEQVWQIYLKNGATGVNAFTSRDFTGFVATMPSNKIELFFWMESDRMANAVFREFYAELDVVREERRLYENSPTFFFFETFNAIKYDVHSYRHHIIGWMVDLDNMTLAKVMKHHDTYYVPNNAVIALVGDIKAQDAFELAEKYFGRIPRAEPPPPVVTTEPPQRYEKRLYAEIDTQPFVIATYHVPSVRHPDMYPLQVLSRVLSGDAGRLYKEIVRKQELATSCTCGWGPGKFPGTFTFHGILKGDHKPRKLEEAIYAIIEELKSKPVEPGDLKRAKKQLRAEYIRALASNGHLAHLLAASAILHDWRELLEAPAKFARVTAEDIMRVAKKYFTKTNRTVGIVTQPEKAPDPYITVLVRTMPRTPEAEKQVQTARSFLGAQVPDLNIRMDEKNIYIEVGHFKLTDEKSALKRLEEVRGYEMSGMKPFADAKLVNVGQEKEERQQDPKAPEPRKEKEEKRTPEIREY